MADRSRQTLDLASKRSVSFDTTSPEDNSSPGTPTGSIASTSSRKGPPPLSKDKIWHAFFSYSKNVSDQEWVTNVIRRLEKEYGYKCCDHRRDFTPGWRVLDNIIHCVMSSAKTVVIMSKASTKSHWVSYEAEFTMHMSVDMRKSIIVPVLLDDCTIPCHLRPLTYVDARGNPETWWSKLLDALDAPETLPDYPNSPFLPLSSKAFRFNPYYNNLDRLCEVRSTACPAFGLKFNQLYIPEALMSRGINVPRQEYSSAVANLLKDTRIKMHCCCYQLVIWIVVWPMVISAGVTANIIGLKSCHFEDYTSVDSTSTPKSMEKCPDLGTEQTKSMLFIFGIPLVILLVQIMFCIIVRVRRIKESNATIARINYSFIPYQILMTVRTRGYGTTACMSFVYYSIQPCLDHVREILSIASDCGTLYSLKKQKTKRWRWKLDSRRKWPTKLQDISVSIVTKDKDEQTRKDEETSFSNIEEEAKYLLMKHSATYVRLFLTEELDFPKKQRHTRQCLCLCQYIETIDKKYRDMLQKSGLNRTDLILEDPESYRDIIHQSRKGSFIV